MIEYDPKKLTIWYNLTIEYESESDFMRIIYIYQTIKGSQFKEIFWYISDYSKNQNWFYSVRIEIKH